MKDVRSLIEQSVVSSLGKFESDRKLETRVILGTARARSGNHRPIFECEILVEGDNALRPIFVKKSDPDLVKVLKNCLKVSEKMLRRSSKIKEYLKKHKKDDLEYCLSS